MVKLGPLELDGSRPIVAVPFVQPAEAGVVERARSVGLDVAELRIDRWGVTDSAAVLAGVDRFRGLPTLATIRARNEGGQWSGTEQERSRLFEALMDRVDAVDVELESAEIRSRVVALAHEAERTAVVSFHDFERTPSTEELSARVDEGIASGADIVKLATLAHGDGDVRALASLLLERSDANLVVIAMGPHGAKSRVFFPALGSLFTFAALDSATAPGQLGLAEMVRELREYYPAYATFGPQGAR